LRGARRLPYRAEVKALVGLLLFLFFAEDRDTAYAHNLAAPLGWVAQFLVDPLPIKLRLYDVLMLVVLIASPPSGKLVGPMKTALFILLGTTVFCVMYGMLRGGDFRFASWQTYFFLSVVLTAFTVAKVHRTPADFEGLAKWLIACALYRATMCWISYLTWARAYIGASGMYLTSHGDTIPWVVAILILLVNALDRRSAAVSFRNFLISVFLLGAIQWNSRRLAWVSFAMGLAVVYVLLPPGASKRRINRLGLLFVPVVLTYVIVGWGRPERIFLPLRSLSTVSTQEDSSTLARNAENLGLIATANYANPLLGTGWGNPYVYLTLKYDISGGFELWRYVPHNGILGLLAFSGTLGFMGFWFAFPTSVFLNARVARLARDPRARSVGTIGAAQLIVCANQFYGDMGLFTQQSVYVMAISYAIALRMPQVAGVWGAPATKPKAAKRIDEVSASSVSHAADGRRG
jgi:hypothetical protein